MGAGTSHCQKAPMTPDQKKGDITEKSLGFSLASCSSLLWMNPVQTPGEPRNCGTQGKARGGTERKQALNGATALLRCCSSWESC